MRPIAKGFAFLGCLVRAARSIARGESDIEIRDSFDGKGVRELELLGRCDPVV